MAIETVRVVLDLEGVAAGDDWRSDLGQTLREFDYGDVQLSVVAEVGPRGYPRIAVEGSIWPLREWLLDNYGDEETVDSEIAGARADAQIRGGK